MRERVVEMMEAVVNHAWINLAFGLILLASGLYETIAEFEGSFALRAHHGVLLLGFAHSFRSLAMVLKGLKRL